jgi:small subunit ribosomal protein S18
MSDNEQPARYGGDAAPRGEGEEPRSRFGAGAQGERFGGGGPGERPGGGGGRGPGGASGRGAGGPGGRGPRRGGGGGRFGGRRKVCGFCVDKIDEVDYKDIPRLRRYISERGKIEPRRKLGTCARHQRSLTTAIKRARHVALLPFTTASR